MIGTRISTCLLLIIVIIITAASSSILSVLGEEEEEEEGVLAVINKISNSSIDSDTTTRDGLDSALSQQRQQKQQQSQSSRRHRRHDRLLKRIPQKCQNDKEWLTKQEYPVFNKTSYSPPIELKHKKCGWVKKDPTIRCNSVGEDGRRANDACLKACSSCRVKKSDEAYYDKFCTNIEQDNTLYEAVMGGQWFCDTEDDICHEEPARYFQYDMKNGRVWIQGETWHGTDYEGFWGANWWICGLTYAQNYWGESGFGLIEFIMTNSKESREQQLRYAAQGGFTPHRYYNRNCDIAVLQPNDNMKIWANKYAPSVIEGTETTKPNTTDYNLLWQGLKEGSVWTFSYCSGIASGIYAKQLFFAVNDAAVIAANNGTRPPGDGSEGRDNGIRVNMSYRTKLVLSPEDKCKLKRRFAHLIIPRSKKFNKKTEPYPFDPTIDCVTC